VRAATCSTVRVSWVPGVRALGAAIAKRDPREFCTARGEWRSIATGISLNLRLLRTAVKRVCESCFRIVFYESKW
jgi:hypothetical protein